MNKIRRTWSLMFGCWQVLKQDRNLLVFPLISGICCLMLLGSFALPLWVTDHWRPPGFAGSQGQPLLYYGLLFVFYLCNYFIVVFFNAGIVACATMRMSGGNPTIGDGFRAAAARLPVIAGWALLSATVGLVLRLIEDRSRWVGRIVAGLLGGAWTAVTFLVVPLLVLENKSPFAALKESTVLLKRTWGEQVAGSFSFGLIFFLLSIPPVAFVALVCFTANLVLILGAIALAVIYFVILALVQSALHSIFQAALFLYARDGRVPEGFDGAVLGNAMLQR